nr:MAG TPA: Protein of unknown function (DUF3426) [Caudoviricetes sp.]
MKCTKCGAEFEGKFCPECGNPAPGTQPNQAAPAAQPKKKKRGCLTAIVVIVALGIVGAALSQGGSKGSDSSAVTAGTSQAASTTASVAGNKWDDKFEVKDLALNGSGIDAKVTGSIVNKTDKEYGYLQVEINLYDDSGAQIGSTLANVNNLEAKGTWKFEAYTMKEGVKSVKLKDVVGF